MSLKTEWAENRWLRRQVAFLPVMALWLALTIWLSLGLLGFVLTLLPDSAYVACCVMTGRAAGELRVARRAETARLTKEAAELRTPRAPDAGPDQCPVCGGCGLSDLAKDDAFMERGDRARVVAWGRKRAHWDCAEWSPYVPTAEDKACDTHDREHRKGQRVSSCDWCFTEDIRWEREEAQRRFERSWPELMQPAGRGDRQIRLNRTADPAFRHWLIHEGAPSRHMDILIIESCEKAWDGFGWIAHLAEPLRHGLHVMQNTAQRVMPLDSERLWNSEAGRPFTRTELGLCDCGAAVTTGRVSASEFDAYLRDTEAKLRKAEINISWLSADLKNWRD